MEEFEKNIIKKKYNGGRFIDKQVLLEHLREKIGAVPLMMLRNHPDPNNQNYILTDVGFCLNRKYNIVNCARYRRIDSFRLL